MSDELFQAPSLEYLGEHLPQYEFVDFIAQGGMGAVYKARQISLDRIVAIKVLPHELGENEEFRESFSKEAKAMAKLNHPNLIGVFDSGDVDGMPYIVMEYIEGSSLHDSCFGHKIETEQAVEIVKGICGGLADAHEHGIIHRDIKPANILLTSKAVPKIGDFGLAHPSDSEEQGLIMGTPGYTAPEIFDDPDQAGALADQYSVGVILHQLVSGIDPQGREGPPTEAIGNIRLDAIWRKATNINPAKRYPSVAEMAEDLKNLKKSKAAPPAAGRALQVGTPSIKPAMVQSAQPGGGGVIVKLIVLVLLAAAGWYGYQYYEQNKEKVHQQLIGEEEPDTPAPGTQPGPGTAPAPIGGHKPNPGNSNPDEISTNSEPTTRPRFKPRPRPTAVAPGPSLPDLTSQPRPRPRPQPQTTPKPGLPPGDPELLQKATALILDARKKRDALLDKNASAFQRLLDSEAATAASSDARKYQQVRDECDDGWLPEPDDVHNLNGKLSRAYYEAYEEQKKIDLRYVAELNRTRKFYVSMLEKAADSASDSEQKKRLLAQAKRAGNLAKWAAALAPE